ncbi:unnamed protein product, partial [Strongylus vulgaris]
MYRTIQPPSHNSLDTITGTVSMEFSTEPFRPPAPEDTETEGYNETK